MSKTVTWLSFPPSPEVICHFLLLAKGSLESLSSCCLLWREPNVGTLQTTCFSNEKTTHQNIHFRIGLRGSLQPETTSSAPLFTLSLFSINLVFPPGYLSCQNPQEYQIGPTYKPGSTKSYDREALPSFIPLAKKPFDAQITPLQHWSLLLF